MCCAEHESGLSSSDRPEEQSPPVATAQPEADPPSAEMGFYLEEACMFLVVRVVEGRNASL